MLIERAPSFIKRLPGVKWASRKLFSPRYVGAWVYSRENMEWLSEAAYRRQLPLPLKLFAFFAAAQVPLFPRVIGGRHVLAGTQALARSFGTGSDLHLRIGDFSVWLDLYDPRSLEIPAELIKPSAELRVLERYLGPGDTFLDVGANYGTFSLVASGLVGSSGLVVSVEPQPRVSEMLERSLSASGQSPYCVLRIACGDRKQTTEFFVPSGTSGNASLFRSYAGASGSKSFPVQVERLDDAADWRSFPGDVFLKLDVEGSEMAFLRGAEEMIRARRPHVLIEINSKSMASAGFDKEALVAYLGSLGYSSYVLPEQVDATRSLRDLDASRQVNVILTPGPRVLQP